MNLHGFPPYPCTSPLDRAKSGETAKLKEDADLAQKMGFDAGYLNSIPQFGVLEIRFANQAKFHPRKYLGGLIETVPGKAACTFSTKDGGQGIRRRKTPRQSEWTLDRLRSRRDRNK